MEVESNQLILTRIYLHLIKKVDSGFGGFASLHLGWGYEKQGKRLLRPSDKGKKSQIRSDKRDSQNMSGVQVRGMCPRACSDSRPGRPQPMQDRRNFVIEINRSAVSCFGRYLGMLCLVNDKDRTAPIKYLIQIFFVPS